MSNSLVRLIALSAK